MKFLKKPAGAVFLTILVVCLSVLISTKIKLGAECQHITDSFYDGVEFDGYVHKSIASQLRNISGAADGLVTIANNYDIATDDVLMHNDYLKTSIAYGPISLVYTNYVDLMKELSVLQGALSDAQLSERDISGFESYTSVISGAQSVIEKAGYNENVRTFLRKKLQFPADLLADLINVELPELFE